MNRKTLDIITFRIGMVCAVLSSIFFVIPGGETIGMYLVGGVVTTALLTILFPTRNIAKKG